MLVGGSDLCWMLTRAIYAANAANRAAILLRPGVVVAIRKARLAIALVPLSLALQLGKCELAGG